MSKAKQCKWWGLQEIFFWFDLVCIVTARSKKKKKKLALNNKIKPWNLIVMQLQKQCDFNRYKYQSRQSNKIQMPPTQKHSKKQYVYHLSNTICFAICITINKCIQMFYEIKIRFFTAGIHIAMLQSTVTN